MTKMTKTAVTVCSCFWYSENW